MTRYNQFGQALDAYGRPIGSLPSGSGMPGYHLPPPPPPGASAMVVQPDIPDMAGRDPNMPSWYRMPFFPTAPFYSTNPKVGYQPRFYSGGIINQAAGAEVIVTVQFDLPCRLIAINGSAVDTTGAALPVGLDPRDTFLFRLEYTTGDRLHITQRLGSTVVGTAQRPGEVGATGYTINQGASVTLGITPLRANLRVDITLHTLEMRGARNFDIPE